MNKIYRIILILLFLFLFIFNLAFFLYEDGVSAYFKTDYQMEKPEDIIKSINESLGNGERGGVFDLGVINDKKFKDLKDFDIDPNNISMPGDIMINPDNDSSDIITKDVSLEPSFEVGNPDPFFPRF